MGRRGKKKNKKGNKSMVKNWKSFAKEHGTVTYMSCRHEPTYVFGLDGIKYHACSKSKLPWTWGGVTLNLLGNNNLLETVQYIKTSPEWQDLEKFSEHDPPLEDCVVIDWPDGSTPPVSPEFWKAFHEMCVKRETDPLIYCIGGHGRTGTALASIILTCSDKLNSPEGVIHLIKETYCKKAIETYKQIKYLYALMDKEPPTYSECDKLWDLWPNVTHHNKIGGWSQ
jgi:protein-tyrosine phosphatase